MDIFTSKSIETVLKAKEISSIGITYSVLLDLQSELKSDETFVSQDTGECITHEEISRALGILNGIISTKKWNINKSKYVF